MKRKHFFSSLDERTKQASSAFCKILASAGIEVPEDCLVENDNLVIVIPRFKEESEDNMDVIVFLDELGLIQYIKTYQKTYMVQIRTQKAVNTFAFYVQWFRSRNHEFDIHIWHSTLMNRDHESKSAEVLRVNGARSGDDFGNMAAIIAHSVLSTSCTNI